jgi:hypothetical protein
MFGPQASSEEWFEKRDAKKCIGTVQACIPDLRALGWGFVGTVDEHHSRKERLAETWAKGPQMIVCRWREDGTQDVACEVTTFDAD